MSAITLKAERRGTGKKVAGSLRREGKVPGVYYANGEAGIPIVSSPLDLRPIVYTKATHVVDLNIEGDATPHKCILKDISFDPITDNIVHFDLLGLIEGKKVALSIPLNFTGQSVAETRGGIVNILKSKVRVECVPADIPDHIEVDISSLDIGSKLRIKHLEHDKVRILEAGETVICNAAMPKRAEAVEGEEEVAGEAGAGDAGEAGGGAEAE